MASIYSPTAVGQLPVAHWHDALGDPTLADAILDRLIHHAHALNLAGESLRKLKPKLTEEPPQRKQHPPGASLRSERPACPGTGVQFRLDWLSGLGGIGTNPQFCGRGDAASPKRLAASAALACDADDVEGGFSPRRSGEPLGNDAQQGAQE